MSWRSLVSLLWRLKVTTTILLASAYADSTTVINEIHYHPANGSQTEWIELANTMSYDMDLGGWQLTGAVEYTFPKDTTIAASEFLVVAADPSKVRLRSAFEKALGPFEGNLSNQGERIELRNVANRVMSVVNYNDREPWPEAADGSGATLAKLHQETDSATVESWAASFRYGGSPGSDNFNTPKLPIVIEETAPAGDPTAFWMETSPGDLKDHVVAIAGDRQREVVLPEGNAVIVSGDQLGFTTNKGDLLCLYSPNKTQVLSAVRLDDVVRGRSVDHPGRWLFPAEASPREPNPFSFNDAIVINEIMYRSYPLAASPPEPPVFEQQPLVDGDTQWRFWQGVPQQGEAWRQIGFDDAEWSQGLAPFRGGNTALPEERGDATPINIGKSTYYFRVPFNINTIAEGQTLQLRHLVDDGAVLYLNGEEITRFNLPEGEIKSSTRAVDLIEAPAWSETVIVPRDRLRIGTNVLAAEVHQNSAFDRDVAFSAEVSLGKLIEPGAPALPFRDNSEEWIELYNRSDAAVELSGWTLDEAVRFDFPDGSIIKPNGFFVIASGADGFRGSLDNSGENILLRDQHGNPADEVRYYDGGRWPAYADGGGSSLELRDPNADNSRAEAWAASNECNKAEWQEIRYRMNSGQNYGLNIWDELVIGMLTAGEVLVDDVKIIHDPNGEANQLIPNSAIKGTLFNNDAAQRWRFVGNHRHSTAVPDPDDPNNMVLHLRASGATDTKHNHVETTLSDKLIDGDEYEVSMRARWVAGSNQLNIRGYYARLAKTIELATPNDLGTPGEQNSRFVENIGPTYAEFRHSPLMPAADEIVSVSVQAKDSDGIELLTLHYAKDGDSGFIRVPMEESDGIYTAEIPGMAAATVVQLYVEGTDALGVASHFPASGPNSRALYIVDDGRSTDLPVHELRLIMKEADFDFMFDELNLISNERLGCSVLVDNREIIYNTGVRLKGSPAGRARDGALYQGFNIGFPPEQLYRGIHDSVSIDRSGRAPTPGDQDEIYVKHLFNRAGIPYMFDDLGYIVSPTRTRTGTALFSMARYGRTFTNTQFENGSKGSVFNLEITYDPTTASSGRESVKKPVPFSHGDMTDFADLGEDKEQYRWPLEMRTGRRADDYEGLINFCKTMDLPNDQLGRKIDEVMDVDAWMRAAAMHNLSGIGDTWWNAGLQHNLRLYVPQGGRGVVGLPWDLDFVFTGSATGPIKSAGGNLRRVMDIPTNTRIYYGHLLDMVDTVFNPEYMEPWLAHYGNVIDQNFSGRLSYIRSRSNFVRSRVRSEVPPISFSITTNGGESMSTEARSITLEGEGWVNVRSVRFTDREEPLEVTWTTSKTWEISVPLVFGANTISLQSVDFQGKDLGSLFSPGSDSIIITSTAKEPTPFEHLRITELHYHPADDGDLEFIELLNLSDQPLDLTGVTFDDGIDFSFEDGTSMVAGDYALVVRNRAAFESHYGSDLPIVGEYGPATSLSNRGERLELLDGPHRILAFAYRDDWFESTDGQGESLQVIDVQSDRSKWREVESWGTGSPSPGKADETKPPLPTVEWTTVMETGEVTEASYLRPIGMETVVEISNNLEDWNATVLDKITVSPMGDLEEVTLHIPRQEKAQYVRIVVK
ncbi:MAG: lamin tail domain-containing protein [Verrucomicrobiales bacterium]